MSREYRPAVFINKLKVHKLDALSLGMAKKVTTENHTFYGVTAVRDGRGFRNLTSVVSRSGKREVINPICTDELGIEEIIDQGDKIEVTTRTMRGAIRKAAREFKKPERLAELTLSTHSSS